MRLVLPLVFLTLLSAGCRKPETPAARVLEEDRPVVPVPPVQTVPFEEGYKLGYTAGTEAGKPRAPLPTQDEAADKAREAAGDDPDHNEKWRNGYAEGYMDGFRSVTKHLK